MTAMLLSILAIAIHSHPVPPEDIARAIREIRDRTPSSMHEFECIEYKTRHVVDAHTPVVEEVDRRMRFRVLKHEHRYRVEVSGVENDVDPPKLIRTLVWDGERYMTAERDHKGVTHVTIRSEPRIILQQCVSLFCETHGRDVSIVDIAKSVEMASGIEQIIEGDRLTHVFRFPEAKLQIMTLGMRLGNSPRIESFALALYRDAPQGQPRRLSTYHVLEWMKFNDHDLPQLAIYDSEGDVPENGVTRRLFARTEYRRVSTTDLTDNPPALEQFTIETKPGDHVLDKRTALGWTVGEPHVLVDGTLYQLQERVMDDPYHRLPELMAWAYPVVASPVQTPPEPVSSHLRRGTIAALACTPLLMIMLIRLYPAGRSHANTEMSKRL